jgi:asparagine synthase (glutamine-hydrolysing)
MCGIFCYQGKKYTYEQLINNFFSIRNRGPDSSILQQIDEDKILGFHRLSINDISNFGSQPLYHPDDNNLILICNGEIYNHKNLKESNDFKMCSKSDCEVILHLYKKFGIGYTLQQLDGVFSLVIIDKNLNKTFVARDPFGVRGLFFSMEDEQLFVCSELKGISKLCNSASPFPPSHYYDSESKVFTRYYCVPSLEIENNEELILKNIKEKFTNAVYKRMMSDRPIAALLSGGLDSSLVCGILSQKIKNLKTFSIGLEGSVDLKYAKMVADHIKSEHYSIELTEEEFLENIENVIKIIESYDTTTVRASVGNYLVSKFLSENCDSKVIFCGDGSDEQSGYRYLQNAPTIQEFQDECFKLLNEIYLYDALRSDRTISSNGLEARVPFLDKDFVSYYMSIDPKLKTYSKDKIEKYLLRKAFDNDNILPKEVLWRSKCAFSDGVSNKKKSWHIIIQNFLEDKVSEDELLNAQKLYPHNTPKTKEAYYYRKIFEKYYPKKCYVIPHFWMPKWCGNVNDPSARELEINVEN